MHLDDLFKEYKKYTGDKSEYSSSNIAKKLKDSFSKYGLDDYISLITPREQKSYSTETMYTFTEDEVKMLGLFLGCATSRYVKKNNKFPDKSILNPFLYHFRPNSMGITDMKKFTNEYIRHAKDADSFVSPINLVKIHEFMEFTFKLKKCLKKLIIAIFYMNRFNKSTFDRILSMLNNFADELYLLGGIKDSPESDDSLQTDTSDVFYRSIDVLIASDVEEFIYTSKIAKSEEEGNIQDILSWILKNFNPEDILSTPPKSYEEHLKNTIFELYNNYINLLSYGYDDDDIEKKYSTQLGVDLNATSVERLIYYKYVKEKGKEVVNRIIEMDMAVDKTYKDIMDILTEIRKEADKKNEENTDLDDVLDKLLFKPFLKFHKEDLNILKNKIENRESSMSNADSYKVTTE